MATSQSTLWEEEEVFDIGDGVIARAEEEHQHCLIGKFLTDKPINEWVMQDVLKKVWKMHKEVIISEVKKGIFAFKFNSPIMLARVFEGGPWSFDDHVLVLRKWSPEIAVELYEFDSIDTWVQARGLEFHLVNEEIGRQVGAPLGKVLAVETRADNQGQGRFLRIRVTIPTGKPLRRGAAFKIKGNKVWVSYKYERIPSVCFYCGSIEHRTMQCEVEHPQEATGKELPYGGWLLVNGWDARFRDEEGYQRGGRGFANNRGGFGQAGRGRGMWDREGRNNGHVDRGATDEGGRGAMQEQGQGSGKTAMVTAAPQQQRGMEINPPIQASMQGLKIQETETQPAQLKQKEVMVFEATRSTNLSATETTRSKAKESGETKAVGESKAEKIIRRKVELRGQEGSSTLLSPAKRKTGAEEEGIDFTVATQGEEKKSKQVEHEWTEEETNTVTNMMDMAEAAGQPRPSQ